MKIAKFRVVLVATALIVTSSLSFANASPANAAGACSGGDNRWTGASDFDFSNPANWTAGSPTAGSTVCIPSAPATQPVVVSNKTVSAIHSEAGSSIIIGSGRLTVSNPSTFSTLRMAGGAFSYLPAGATFDGDLIFQSGEITSNETRFSGTNTFSGAGSKTFTGNAWLTGPSTWSGGNLSAGQLLNLSVFTMTTPASSTFHGDFYSPGVFNHTSSASNVFDGNISNIGNFEVAAGEIKLSNSTWTFANFSNATFDTGRLDLAGSTFVNNDPNASTYTGSAGGITGGSISYLDGVLIVNGGLNANLDISGGETSITGSINSNIALSGGIMNVGINSDRALTNSGDFTQSGGTLVFEVNGANASDVDTMTSNHFAVSGPSTLKIDTAPYVPAVGRSVNIASYSGNATGTYATVTDDLAAGQDWSVNLGASPLTLTLTDGSTPPIPTPTPTPTAGPGYWTVGADGKVYNFGSAQNYGGPNQGRQNAAATSVAATASGKGYYVTGRDGGVFSFGDAQFAGSTGDLKLNAPVVSMATNPAGSGYWTVAADGGVFAFGGAQFYGSTASMKLNAPIVGLAPTPTGKGYWLVASDGGVFSFGDATFKGSTGNIKLNSPVVSMASDVTTGGYWLTAADGGVFSFGGAKFHGSTANLKLNAPVVGIRPLSDGKCYWLIAADGGTFTFGAAPFLGVPGAGLTAPIVG